MVTKAYQRFDARITAYDSDLELADVLIDRFIDLPNSIRSVGHAIDAWPASHPNLYGRRNTRASRNIVGRHLKNTIHSAVIKDLYEDFAEYISSSLSRAALAGIDPARFVGEVKLDLHATEIIGAGSWENVVRLVSDKIFRALENERSTIILLDKISRRLGLNLDGAVLNAAMPYLDARHILVHRDGLADEIYKKAYPDIVLQDNWIFLNLDFMDNARNAVRTLALHVDEQLVAAGLVRPEDFPAGRRPTNS